MSTLAPEQVQLPVAILTDSFQIRGKLAILGTFLTFLNDEAKPTFDILNPVVIGVSTSNPAAQMSQSEMFILKRAVHALCIESGVPQGVTLPPRTELLMAYTSQYAIGGKWHMTPDARIADFVDASHAMFLPVSDVHIYPLTNVRQGIIPAAPLVMVHRNLIQSYHKG
jgi:hypothetical protein